MAPPGPVKIGHKKDGRQRQPHRFHVSRAPPLTRPLDPLLATKHLNLLLVTFNPLGHTNENGKGAHCPLKLMHLLQGKGLAGYVTEARYFTLYTQTSDSKSHLHQDKTLTFLPPPKKSCQDIRKYYASLPSPQKVTTNQLPLEQATPWNRHPPEQAPPEQPPPCRPAARDAGIPPARHAGIPPPLPWTDRHL